MKRHKTFFFRCYIALLCGVLAWSVLTYGQTTNTVVKSERAGTETVTTVTTNSTPALSFGLDRIPELRREVAGIPAWQYLASAIYVILAIFVAKIFDYLVTVQLRKLAAKTRWKLDDFLIELLHGPVRMLVLVLLLRAGLNLYRWPLWLKTWLANGLYLLLACSVTYMLVKLVDLAGRYWRSRSTVHTDKAFNDLLLPMLTKSFKVFIVIMAVLVTLDNVGFNIRTLLAGVSISGLALGLAAQDTVGNLFGAAAVFVDKPFKIGDFITMEGISGSIEEIGLRSTRMRNPDGHLITVPNKTMGNATITNITRRPNIKTTMNIGITYDTPAERVKRAVEILKEIYGGNPMTHDLILGFNQFADNALNIQVIHWWKGVDYKQFVAGMQEMNLKVKERFDQEKIGFAFPSRTVYLRQEGEWDVQVSQDKQSRPV